MPRGHLASLLCCGSHGYCCSLLYLPWPCLFLRTATAAGSCPSCPLVPSPVPGSLCLLWVPLLGPAWRFTGPKPHWILWLLPQASPGWVPAIGADSGPGAASCSFLGPTAGPLRCQRVAGLSGNSCFSKLVAVLTTHHQDSPVHLYTNTVVKFSFSYLFMEAEAHERKRAQGP